MFHRNLIVVHLANGFLMLICVEEMTYGKNTLSYTGHCYLGKRMPGSWSMTVHMEVVVVTEIESVASLCY